MFGKKDNERQDKTLKVVVNNQNQIIKNQNHILKDGKAYWSWIQYLEKERKNQSQINTDLINLVKELRNDVAKLTKASHTHETVTKPMEPTES